MYALARAGFARFHESVRMIPLLRGLRRHNQAVIAYCELFIQDRLPASCTTMSSKHALVISCSIHETQQQVLDLLLRSALNLLDRKRAEGQQLAELRCRLVLLRRY